MDIQILNSIDECSSAQWDSLFESRYPFIQHRFLSLLESSGSACANSGWEPKHLLITDNGSPVAAMPLYLKQHSWGEYVFDHSWADAYQRHGLDYFPKLVTSIPFTPAMGPRLGIAPHIDKTLLLPELLETLQQCAKEWGVSSWHLLFPEQVFPKQIFPQHVFPEQALPQQGFPEPSLSNQLQQLGLMKRTGVQYHWFNGNDQNAYESFEDFTDTFTSRKRKNILKERRCANQQLTIRRLDADEITPDWWEFFHIMYQRTYIKRNGTGGYLTENFFQQLGETMGDQIMMSVAEESDGTKVAAALFFFDDNTLYGRYWGCLKEYDFLHFELCYYQGIDYAIQHQLSRFDAGAQGEHKIKRGFKPIETHSLHWIQHSDFASAIQSFLDQETGHIKEYISQSCELLPYKSTCK